MYRYFSYFLALITFSFVAWEYLSSVQSLGFPDGHITEYGQASKTLFMVFALPYISLAFYFLYLGLNSFKQNTKIRMWSAIIILCFLCVMYFAIDWYLYGYLNHGQGG